MRSTVNLYAKDITKSVPPSFLLSQNLWRGAMIYMHSAAKNEQFNRCADFHGDDAWVMCEYNQKHTPTETRSRGQKLARIEVLALSMCWRVMISAICTDKNEVRIQEMSWFLCVGCVGCALAVRVQGNKHTSRSTLKSAKSNTKLYPNYQYVFEGWWYPEYLQSATKMSSELIPWNSRNSRDERIDFGGPFATETPKINGGAHYRKIFRNFFGDRFNTALGSFRKIPAFRFEICFCWDNKKKKIFLFPIFFFSFNQQPTMSFPLASREPHESKNI